MPFSAKDQTIDNMSPGARMMLGIAIGDAFGARFENQTRGSITLEGEEGTYQNWNLYTDDTQMAIAVSDLLLSGQPLTGENLADAFITAYRREPRCGYSRITRRALEESGDGSEFLLSLSQDEIANRRSDGSAMRALPIGLLPDKSEVIRVAQNSSAITHGHPDALAATVGIALLAHDRYYTGRQFNESLGEILNIIPDLTNQAHSYLNQILNRWDPEVILAGHKEYGVPYTDALIFFGAVIGVLATFGEDPGQALLQAVKLGGDTDTTASVILGAALIWPGAPTLEESLINDLENGQYGRDFLITMGDQLTKKYPSPRIR